MTDKLRALPNNLDDTDLGGLQNLHSEMLATASDIGFEPGDAVLVEITAIPQGLQVVREFHADITKFLAGVDAKEYKPGVPPAAAKPKKKPAPEKPADKTSAAEARKKSPQELMADQKAARLARDASEPKPETAAKPAKKQKEKSVAKKAKKTVKKAAKKSATTNARTSVDGTKKITWLLKDKDLGARDGSERAERRKKLKAASGKTVDAYVKGGGSIATLNRAVTEKIVKLG